MSTPINRLTSIDLGKQGEHLARFIEIDVSEWTEQWPNAAFYILYQRHNDTVPYQVQNLTLTNGILKWTFTKTDTGVYGSGSAEIRAVQGDVIAKSTTVVTNVEATIGDSTGSNTALQQYLESISESIAENTSSISANAETIEANKAILDETNETLEALQDDYTYASNDEIDAMNWG